MTIRAVFFDMGGTIETFSRSTKLCLQATPGLQDLLRSAGIDLQLDDRRLFQIILAGLDRYHKWTLKTLDELPSERVCSEFIFTDLPVDRARLAGIAEDLMFYIETRYYQRAMRPEMPEVLEAIRRRGLKIGLISNVCSKGQVPVNLTQYGIRQYFDPLVLSSDYGRRKPDPAIFHYAARLANVPTGECAYIGDRIARDVLGARRAGYRLAVQIRHEYDHGEEDTGAAPDAIIDRMTEFVEILQAGMESDTNPAAGKGSRQIRALLFDAGDILYYRLNHGRKLAAYLRKIGLTYKELPEETLVALRNRAYQGLISNEQYYDAILRYSGVTLAEHLERGKILLEEESNETSFFEGVRETLIALDQMGYLLGIITDTAVPLHVKLSWFERGGFGQVWDSVISSKELGFRKPDPRIYQVALRQLGVSAGQAVFVGHQKNELDGAKNVGLATIAFNYAEGVEADYFIARFPELLKIPLLARPESVEQA